MSKVNMYFACHHTEAFIRQQVAMQNRNSPRESQLTLSKDILLQEKLIRDQLKSDGIIVGKWRLCEAQVAYGDDVRPMPNYGSYARAFGVYEESEIRNATPIKIDPYKPITETVTSMRLPSTRYTYTFSQGGISKKVTPSQLYLIMPISFS